MRSFISFSMAVLLLMLVTLTGDVAGQKRKKSKRRHSTASKVAAPSAQATAAPSSPAQEAPAEKAVATTAAAAPQIASEMPADGVRRITPTDARAAFEKGQAIIIDVRSTETYKAGHVKGALSIPVNELVARLQELPRDKMIITYCS